MKTNSTRALVALLAAALLAAAAPAGAAAKLKVTPSCQAGTPGCGG
ncbi:MAG TPA: hypothetical protein VE444_00955 [Gaiellaceae bacterium]|jgi:hypothetical protein|nr:hypothetical protein [Gaiellaceae bacterium]